MKNEIVNRSLKEAIYQQIEAFVGYDEDQTVSICVRDSVVDTDGEITIRYVIRETKHGDEFVHYDVDIKHLTMYDSMTDEQIREYTFEEKREIEKYLNNKIRQE